MSAERLPLGKECTRCGEWKLLEEYYAHRGKRDNRESHCKICSYEREKRYKAENKEKVRERKKRYYTENIETIRKYTRRYLTENKEVIRERKKRYRAEKIEAARERDKRYYEENKEVLLEKAKRYRAKNKEVLSKKRKRYYEENKEAELERAKRYWAENTEVLRAIQQRRRARALGAKGKFAAEQFRELCEVYGNICLCCGEEKKLTADHVIPLSRGGTNDISNIQPLCKPCNSRKGTQTTDYRPLFDEDIEELGETG